MPRHTLEQQTPAPSDQVSPGQHNEGRTLHRDDIVRTAIAIANDEGPQAVSMRRIATKLGAGTMSLYWHVANKERLIDLMLDAVAGDVAMPDPPSGDWRRDMQTIAINTRRVLSRHPWLASFIGTWPWSGPNVLRHTELSLAVFDGAGVDPSTAMQITSAVDAYVIGFVLEEFRSHATRLPTTSTSEPDNSVTPAEGLLGTDAFPRLAGLVAERRVPSADERFTFGLDRLLDGIATYLSGGYDVSGTGR